MGADLVTLVGGLNDVLRPKCDVGRVRGQLEEAVERLAPACGQLVLMRSPGRQGPVLERFRPRMEELFALHRRAGRSGTARWSWTCTASPALGDQRMWDVDRLHLTAEGHRRVAEAVWQALGLAARGDWRPAARRRACRRAGLRGAAADLRFARAAPGAVDRPPADRPLLGRRPPAKRPELLPYERVTAPQARPARSGLVRLGATSDSRDAGRSACVNRQ